MLLLNFGIIRHSRTSSGKSKSNIYNFLKKLNFFHYNDNVSIIYPILAEGIMADLEQASGHVRPERVNKWPNSMKDI
jgi:hypothetical protein